MENFSRKLIDWYRENGRDLPWRRTKNPYLIWISEIILQQTRVAQGYDYYQRFVTRFPDVFALAAADEDEVMKYWRGAGVLFSCEKFACCGQKDGRGRRVSCNIRRGACFERSGGIYGGGYLFICLRYAIRCGGW